MPRTDPRIMRLIEEALDTGRTPEEVCSDNPGLLPAVRERLAQCRGVEAEMEALFPPPVPEAASGAPRPATPRRPSAGAGGATAGLPSVPGYRVEGVLGRGGMGVVYRAHHLKLNRPVALKMLLTGSYATRRERARFVREAEAVAGLRHEHVVTVYDVGECGGQPYFTMELVEGGSLAQRLAGTPQPARDAAALVAELARAVQAAHDSGIVHRDLKPANVLLTVAGTPKVSDFGVARRLAPLAGADTAPTLGGPCGTPNYMAPEQAAGAAGAAGPLVDVYALGAILHEALTGRPPAAAAGPNQKDEAAGLVPPARLDRAVPPDLRSICVRCLNPDPQRRYGTPAALALDLDRFLRGEPVTARPVGLARRVAKWARRRPAEAGLFVGGTLVVIALAGGGLWSWFDRAGTARAVADDLREVARHQSAARWPDARTVLARATARLADGGTDAVRERIRRAAADLDLVAQLDATLLGRAAVIEGRFNTKANQTRADRAYASAFRAAGYGDAGSDPQAMADRIVASEVRDALVAALDDWAACAPDGGRRAWVMSVARLADRQPREARNRLRDPAAWDDRAALGGLTDAALSAGASVQLLVGLGERLHELGGDAVPFLTQIQREHPGDFRANFALGEALRRRKSPDAVRYFQAAVAIQPRAAIAHNNLGVALRENGRPADATEQFRLALRMDRSFAPAHNNMGMAMAADARTAEAIDHFAQAVRVDPEEAGPRNNLGMALRAVGRLDDAIRQFRDALRINPEDPAVHNNIGIALRDAGRTDDAIKHFYDALRVSPAYRDVHVNVGIALAIAGRMDEAIAHYQKALAADPNDGGTHNNLGLALAAKGRTAQAIEHYRTAIRMNPADGPAHNNLGLALRKVGRPDEALVQFREALRINPGDKAAREYLAAAAVEKQRAAGPAR